MGFERLNSTAVMQRRIEPAGSRDDFPTPPWGTRALFQYVLASHTDRFIDTAWEPSCNRGYMASVLCEWFRSCNVILTDAYEYNSAQYDYRILDYTETLTLRRVDWVVTNPPFRLAEEFVLRAMTHTRKGVAILARIAWLEAIGRWERIFSVCPPSIVAVFVERLPIVCGRVDPDAVSATCYAWFVWLHGDVGPSRIVWIPPCRAELERPGDYPPRAPLIRRRYRIMV